MKFLKNILLTFAILTAPITAVYAQSPQAPAPDACMTEQQLKEYAPKDMQVIRLEGIELLGFNATYEKRFNQKAPDVDLVLFFVVDPEVWLITGFKNGCLSAPPQEVPSKIVKELMNGVTVDGQS